MQFVLYHLIYGRFCSLRLSVCVSSQTLKMYNVTAAHMHSTCAHRSVQLPTFYLLYAIAWKESFLLRWILIAECAQSWNYTDMLFKGMRKKNRRKKTKSYFIGVPRVPTEKYWLWWVLAMPFFQYYFYVLLFNTNRRRQRKKISQT